jgi:hypothetical protein
MFPDQLRNGADNSRRRVPPGPTRSEGIIDFLKSLASDPAASPKQIEAEFFAKGRPSSLLQRMIEPDEIANLVAYVGKPAVFGHQWCRASRRRRRHAYDRLRAERDRGSCNGCSAILRCVNQDGPPRLRGQERRTHDDKFEGQCRRPSPHHGTDPDGFR